MGNNKEGLGPSTESHKFRDRDVVYTCIVVLNCLNGKDR